MYKNFAGQKEGMVSLEDKAYTEGLRQILSNFYLPNDAQLNCLKKQF
jgi:hypothetical protein